MAQGRKTGGRVKGTPNKMTVAVKDVLAEAANKLGGVDRLVEWVKEDPKNEHSFWSSMYPRLLPVQVTGPGENGEHLVASIARRVIDEVAE